MDPQDYVRDISDEENGSQCLLLIVKGQTPFLVMGLPLYKGYYTVHDDANSRLGFVPHVGSTKNGPYYAASFPTIDLRSAERRTDYSNLDNHGS